MKRSFGLWELFGFGVAALGGTILHFLYDWLGKGVWIAPFSGVNESTWEHMKLLFWPSFLFAIVQSFFFSDQKNFWCIKVRGILLGLGLIPVLFYTYNGIFGRSPDWVNVSIFYVTTASAFLLEWWLFKQDAMLCKWPWLPFIVICAIGISFVIFTFAPPHIPLFRDPITGAYGLHC